MFAIVLGVCVFGVVLAAGSRLRSFLAARKPAAPTISGERAALATMPAAERAAFRDWAARPADSAPLNLSR